MSQTKTRIADLLFGVQILGALVFCVPYALRSLTDVTGSSLVQFCQVAAFLLFNLSLGWSAHRAAPSRITRQLLTSYTVWLVLIGGIIAAVLHNPNYQWNSRETEFVRTAVILTCAVVALSLVQRLPLSDPMIRAGMGIAYKSVPQVLLAYKFLAEGATGTPGLSVAVGHATIIIRLTQILFTVREAGWDRNRFWLAVSESANEASWIAATTAWIIRS